MARRLANQITHPSPDVAAAFDQLWAAWKANPGGDGTTRQERRGWTALIKALQALPPPPEEKLDTEEA
jgi:hypothetical protein